MVAAAGRDGATATLDGMLAATALAVGAARAALVVRGEGSDALTLGERPSGGAGCRTLVVSVPGPSGPIGELELERAGHRPFSAAERAAATAAAGQLGLVVAQGRLLRRAHRHGSDQAGLLRVSRAATASLELGPVLAEIARASLGVAGAECCAVLLRLSADEVELAAESTIADWPGVVLPGVRFPVADWAAYRLALAGSEPLEFGGDTVFLSPRERAYYANEGIASALLVPLRIGDECAGLLALYARRAGAFSSHEVALGVELAAQAALAVHNARLLADTRRRAEEQAALFRVGQAAVASLTLDTVLVDIATATLGLAGTECCGIDLWRSETDELECIAEATIPEWPGVPAPGTRYPLADWPSVRGALQAAGPLRVRSDDPVLADSERAALVAEGVGTLLWVSLRVGDDVLGLLTLYSRSPDAFAERDVRLAGDIAALAALSIQNARLLDATRRDAAEQAALLRVSRVVISGADLRGVLDEVAQASLGVCGAEACSVDRWRAERDEIEVMALTAVPEWPGVAPGGHRYPLDDRAVLRDVLVGRVPLANFGINDPDLSARDRATFAALGIGGGLAVPLILGSERLGLLKLWSRRQGPFSERAVRFAQDLTAQAAQAIDRARLHASLRERADSDGLTGLLNHRAVLEALDADLAAAHDPAGSVAVLLVDVDDFKLFNDTHGHLVGDRVLRETAHVLREVIGNAGRVGRYGGDEFLVVLPRADTVTAHGTARRLLDVAGTITVGVGSLRLPLQLSVGVAVSPADASTRPELIAYADAAMYASKEAGGGQVGLEGRITRSLEQSPFGALIGLVRAVDRKDRYTRRHSDQVTSVAMRFAGDLGLPADAIEALAIAGPLHDVGKIAVPDAVLRKPGLLNPTEQAILRQHVEFGELMVQGVPHQEAVQAAIGHHHERWDGTGYPHGASGTAIPLLGRILALADAYSAIIHDRPYRKGKSVGQAIAILRTGAGTQFDPDLVEPFAATVASLALEHEWALPRNEPQPEPSAVGD